MNESVVFIWLDLAADDFTPCQLYRSNRQSWTKLCMGGGGLAVSSWRLSSWRSRSRSLCSARLSVSSLCSSLPMPLNGLWFEAAAVPDAVAIYLASSKFVLHGLPKRRREGFDLTFQERCETFLCRLFRTRTGCAPWLPTKLTKCIRVGYLHKISTSSKRL